MIVCLQRCRGGYYGNPSQGTPNDCKLCKCPLGVMTNNFSPTCRAVSGGVQAGYSSSIFSIGPQEYVCDACPRGYEGPHCER